MSPQGRLGQNLKVVAEFTVRGSWLTAVTSRR